MEEGIKIIEPSMEISELQKEIIIELSRMIPNSSVESIGSMAVPISGKPEIDVMVVSKDIDEDGKSLVQSGYKQGPVMGGISYLSNTRNGIRIDLQILPVGHKMIGIHRKTLRKLKENVVLSKAYEQFKKSLDGLPKDEYKKKKVEWMKKNLLTDLK